ncbi:hypothetical protein [Streptomyces qinglanensis]|uniref:hypothetical protein n=1 Tax=Streptomyces qinglanensis TaxID=943816 RepID=UPI001112EAEF|nr:hypothetical protein [Streptomyces qinglanensis]MBE9498789.1 hypothetical protein [Streptomyces sp. GKU 257-1]
MENTSRHGGPAPEPAAEFTNIIQEVLTTAEETYGTEDLEYHLERALAFVKRHPELKDWLESQVISLIDSPREGVVELVSFLMHDLHWEAVREAIIERVRHPKGDVSNIRLHEAMLDAFSDSWRDRDLYTRFS